MPGSGLGPTGSCSSGTAEWWTRRCRRRARSPSSPGHRYADDPRGACSHGRCGPGGRGCHIAPSPATARCRCRRYQRRRGTCPPGRQPLGVAPFQTGVAPATTRAFFDQRCCRRHSGGSGSRHRQRGPCQRRLRDGRRHGHLHILRSPDVKRAGGHKGSLRSGRRHRERVSSHPRVSGELPIASAGPERSVRSASALAAVRPLPDGGRRDRPYAFVGVRPRLESRR